MGKLIFISHSSKDAKTASELCNFLENNGRYCFLAPRNIRPGEEYAEEIINGIDDSQAMVLLLSNNSNNSPHVLREIERAVSKGIPIIIYKLEEVQLSKSMEYFLMTSQWLDSDKIGDYRNVLSCIEQAEIRSIKEQINEQGNARGKFDRPWYKTNIFRVAAAVLVVVIAGIAGAVIMDMTDKKSVDDKKEVVSGNNVISNENKSNEEEADTDNEAQITFSDIQVGDTIEFGSYRGEKIEWRVLKLNNDGKSAVIVSKDILCMKAFDAAESGKYNEDDEGNDYYKETSEADTDMELQAYVRGNSDWSKSNIRTWLNSDKEVVKYEDQAPVDKAMTDMKNGYSTEAGFLYEFTEEEKGIILVTKNETPVNALDKKNKTETTEDKVYLLSVDELKWFEDAGISIFAKPTEKTKEVNPGWYETYSYLEVEDYFWWTRTPEADKASKAYLVSNSYYYEDNQTITMSVGCEGYGIRPAMTIKIK